MRMNREIGAGNGKRFKANVEERRGGPAADHLDAMAQQRDRLAGKFQAFYGIGREEAEIQIRRFEGRDRD